MKIFISSEKPTILLSLVIIDDCHFAVACCFDQDEETFVNLDELNGPVRDLLTMDNVRREVGLRFRRFLTGYRDHRSNLVYLTRIERLAQGAVTIKNNRD